MSIITHIVFGCMISLVTSIPFGTINVTVADTAINKSQRAAIWVGFGGAFVQIFQAAISLKFSMLLNTDPAVNKVFILVSIPILIGLALFFLYKKKKFDSYEKTKAESAKGFAKGAFISSLNMINVPFFIFLGGYLGPSNWFHLDNLHILMFAVGTFIGSFTIFIAYAKFGAWIRKKHEKSTEHSGKIVAFFLFAVAIWQTIRYALLD